MNTQKKEIDIIDLLTALHAGRWLIIGGTLAICVLAGGLSFLLPKEYEATVQILPPQEKKQSFGFSSMLASLPIPALRLGERGTPSDISLATIGSATTRRRMVEKFGLMQRYEARTLTDAIEALADNTTAAMTEEGMLAVSVLDKAPHMAADMANYYIVLLDSTNKRFSHKTASDRLDFIRGILQEEDKKLEDKMKRLEEFQSEHNAISIADQSRAAILTATSMQTAVMELGIERQLLIQSGLGPNHDKVKQIERKIGLRLGTLAFLRDGPSPTDNGLLPNKALRLPLDENLFLPL
ncbi:MAG: Wzz/FepE/Etk N-terminal domain-containing protein, partial [Gemmatimonadota bacterium]|nr:Wzz/FepE/Etk N-terminal domain-containing protein [Gemmatimonadota bacterium]